MTNTGSVLHPLRTAVRVSLPQAEEEGIHIEALYMEPVMGEGQPGKVIDREFYDMARKLTKEHSSILVVDSIQAALRARGSLSVVDYPGFEDADAPDMETYSKVGRGAVVRGRVRGASAEVDSHSAFASFARAPRCRRL